MTAVTRRAALGSIALAGAAVVAPQAARAAISTPGPHPDLAVAAALQALAEADEEISAAARRTDEIAAERDGRTVTDDDEAALDEAIEAHDEALDAVLAISPQTAAGVRAILLVIAFEGGWDRKATADALRRLADCPALAWDRAPAPIDRRSFADLAARFAVEAGE